MIYFLFYFSCGVIYEILICMVNTEFPGSKEVTEASSKYGPALVPGPVFFVFEKVSTFIVTGEKVEEAPKESKEREIVIEEKEEKKKDETETETASSEKKEEEVIKEEAPVTVTPPDQPSKVEEKTVEVVAEPPKP